MNRELVQGLLLAKPEDAGNGQEEMLAELQGVLASLRYANEAAIVPDAFCAAYRDFDGMCIAPHEQRDADEVCHICREAFLHPCTGSGLVCPPPLYWLWQPLPPCPTRYWPCRVPLGLLCLL